MVVHPWVGLLVLALACLAVQWNVLQGRGESRKERRVYICQGCQTFPSKLYFQHNPHITNVWPWALYAQLELVMRNFVNYHLQAFFLSWVRETMSLMKTRFPYCYLPCRTLCVLPLTYNGIYIPKFTHLGVKQTDGEAAIGNIKTKQQNNKLLSQECLHMHL